MNEQLAWNPPDAAAQDAAAALEWGGVVLPQVTVFGCRLLPVVVVDVEVHELRQRDGDGPQLDVDTLSMWEWPESSAPAPAVRLTGALFLARRGFGRALGDACRWRPFGPVAVLAPAAMVSDQVRRWECALHGVGLATSDHSTVASGLVPAESGRRGPARRRTADRWIEETLYALALDVGAFTADPGQ